jgi:pimeloyl-ACP methyl ester carboxylesterase
MTHSAATTHLTALLLLIIYLANAATATTDNSNNDFKLTSGTYKPIEVDVLGIKVHKIIGVPYAGLHASFNQPQPLPPRGGGARTNNKNHTNDWPAICIQPMMFQNGLYGNFKLPHEFRMQVNCQTMSLYVPKAARQRGTRRLVPAMVFIHGGSNAAGSATYIDPSALAAHGNVLVAMPNFRIDVLGFLTRQSLFDKPRRGRRMAGNYGLWDQIAALKWLHENCEALGCDRTAITVFGHSAGSSDAMLLAQSPEARPYMARVVMESGSALAHWAFLYERHVYDKIGEVEGGPAASNSLVSLLNLSKSKHVSTINDTLRNFLVFTSCSSTHKYACFKKRLADFFLVLNEANTDKTYSVFREIFNKFDLDEILSFFGYFHKTSMDTMDKKGFYSTFNNTRLTAGVMNRLRKTAVASNASKEEYKSLLIRKNPKVRERLFYRSRGKKNKNP